MQNEEQVKKISNGINDANFNNLLQWNKSEVVLKVEILAAQDSCDYCKNQQGKIFTVEDAIKTRPLPCKECSHEKGYCRCTYLPVI